VITHFARRSGWRVALIAVALVGGSWSVRARVPAAPAALPPAACSFAAASPVFIPLVATFGGVVIDDACQFVYLTNTSLNRVEVYSLQTQSLLAPIQVGAQPIGLDITPDGSTLYVANSGGNNISVVDLATKLEVRKINTPQNQFNDTPYAIAIGNSGKALFTTRNNGVTGSRTLDLVLATDVITPRNDMGGFSTGRPRLRASPDRGTIASPQGGDLYVYNAATDSATLRRTFDTSDVALGPAGATMILSRSQPVVLVLDAARRIAGRIPSASTAPGTAIHPIWNLGFRARLSTIEVLNLSSFLTVGTIPLGDSVTNTGYDNFIGRMDISRDGALLAVITNTGFSIVKTDASGPPPDFNFLRNSKFADGLTSWQPFATPDPSYLDGSVVNGIFEFNRIPGPGPTNQAGISQATGQPLPALAPVEAAFSLGNSSTAPKTITVQVANSDLTDAQSCTFVVPAGAALAGYRMQLKTSQPWTSAAIFVYADTAGSDGGFNRLDNLSLEYKPALSVSSTACIPPPAPQPAHVCDSTIVANHYVPVASTTYGYVRIDPTCRYVYLANTTNNRIDIFSLATLSFEHPIHVGSMPSTFDFTADGNTIYVANRGGENLSIVDLAQRAETRKLTIPAQTSPFNDDTPHSIAMANNGLAIFATTWEGSGSGARMMALNLATDQMVNRTDFDNSGRTTQSTRLGASGDRSAIGIAVGGISSGPVFLYQAGTNTFSAAKNLNTFLATVSLNRTGTRILAMPGSSVLDAALNLTGTITGGSGFGATVHDPRWPIGYRAVGSNLEALNFTTFLEGANVPIGNTVNSAIPSMDITADGQVVALVTDGGFSVIRPPTATPQNVNLVSNGSFSGGAASWQTFATPNASHITWAVNSGVFEFNREPPPPGTSNQAVVFQHTGIALPAGAPVQAQFDLGNSSTARKRISVLLLDADFTDLHVCTFWLPPNSPLATYRMRSHTNQPWSSTAIYFYAATEGSDGGFNRLDNVSLTYDTTLEVDRTECEDPTTPAATGGPDGPELIVNGDFGTGALSPWILFGTINGQVTAGVLEFIRPTTADPAGVALQLTGQPVAVNDILTATFELGNSRTARKRVTVILHDSDFSDLSACTFWLPAGQALAPYTMRSFATKAWTNATLSFYAATIDTAQWAQLDNVSLRTTPSATIVGTECVETDEGSLAPSGAASSRSANRQSAATQASSSQQTGTAVVRLGGSAAGEPSVAGESEWIDLSDATGGRLRFQSWFQAQAAAGEIQIVDEDGNVSTLLAVQSSDEWGSIEIDLEPWLGRRIALRFVRRGVEPEEPIVWRIRHVRLEIDRK
jgi:YVTN family beta-propeller protein